MISGSFCEPSNDPSVNVTPNAPFQINSTEITGRTYIVAGTSCVIYKCLWKKMEVVIKEKNNDKYAKTFENENHIMQALAILPSPWEYIAQYHGFVDKISCSLVMEYLPNGDLLDYLNKNNNLDASHLDQISLEIAYALRYIHSYKIIHCDIKPENIMMNINGHVKLIDFGFSVKLTGDDKFSNLLGTVPFVAPELLGQTPGPYSDKTDMYAYAIVTYMIYARRDPYPGIHSKKGIFELVLMDKRPKIPLFVPNQIVNLINFSWMHDPVKRYSAAQAVDQLEKLKQFSPAKNNEKRIKEAENRQMQDAKEQAGSMDYSKKVGL